MHGIPRETFLKGWFVCQNFRRERSNLGPMLSAVFGLEHAIGASEHDMLLIRSEKGALGAELVLRAGNIHRFAIGFPSRSFVPAGPAGLVE